MIELSTISKTAAQEGFETSKEHLEVKIYSDSDIASKAVTDHII